MALQARAHLQCFGCIYFVLMMLVQLETMPFVPPVSTEGEVVVRGYDIKHWDDNEHVDMVDTDSTNSNSKKKNLLIPTPSDSRIWTYCPSNSSFPKSYCEHIVPDLSGSWVRIPNRTSYAPYCCEWRRGEHLQHPNTCSQERPFNRFEYNGLPWEYVETGDETKEKHVRHQMTGGNSCSCQNFTDDWAWQKQDNDDDSNLMQSLSPDHFCKLLGKRKVLFFGDSTMSQIASTVMNAVMPGGCAPQVYLMTGYTMLGIKKHKLRDADWYTVLQKYQPDFFIWSVGPHIHNELQWKEEIFEVLLANMTSEGTRRAFPNTQFIYRTNQPAGCHFNRTILLPDRVDQAARMFDFEAMNLQYYQWEWFYWRDVYALARCQQVGMRTLDLRMLYSRVDAHPGFDKKGGDCLHFCQPGPLDVVADVLYDLLLEEDEEKKTANAA